MMRAVASLGPAEVQQILDEQGRSFSTSAVTCASRFKSIIGLYMLYMGATYFVLQFSMFKITFFLSIPIYDVSSILV